MTETLNLYISNVHCKQIIFGAPTNNAYASFLDSYADIDVPARVRLLKGPPFSRELQNILHKFQWTEFRNVFRDSVLSNDDLHRNLPTGDTSLLDDSIADTDNHASLLPWRLTGNRQKHTQNNKYTVEDSRQSSYNGSEARPTPRDGEVIGSRHSRDSENGQPDGFEDHEIVSALVLATRENLQRSPRALDFGAVKTQVEQTYGLGSNFWGSSDKDKWFLRSKNVIKWTVVSQTAEILQVC